MKKYIAFLLIIVTAFSCTDYLKEEQVTSLTQDFYNTENGLESFIKGLYVYARVKNEWNANGVQLIDPETDQYMTSGANNAEGMATVAGYGSNVSLIAANVTNYIGAANSTSAPIGAYPEINNCNIALEQIENVHPGKFATATFANSRKAEVLFLRSWAYYLISNQLGAVPLQLKANRTDNGIYNYPKVGMDTIYNVIISDLRWAYDQLPTTQLLERGRATKWACGHLLAKLYLNRAQGATFANSSNPYLKKLYKGSVATDLDSCIYYAEKVITANQGNTGTYKGLANDFWTLFDPKVSETTPSPEVLWAAQFDVNVNLDGRFGNRNCNYHTGDYTNLTGVTRAMAYGRPFGTYKPTDWAYDNFHDRVYDSRYYKTFQHEYISNMPLLSSSTSFTWNATTAAYYNANKPATAAAVTATGKRILFGQRALTYVENTPATAYDSLQVMSQPYQMMARWVKGKKGDLYYRLWVDGNGIGLNQTKAAPFLSVKKFIDPQRGGSTDESNFNSEAGTRDAILMRLAETYLIRAEAYGRKGDYTNALADINVVRYRAAWKAGETRPEVCALWEPQAKTLPAIELQAPYAVSASTTAALLASEANFTPGDPKAIAENYIPTVTTKADMFIHFIYNEKAREFLGEGLSWEDQHNAGILYSRLINCNQEASPLKGLWPVAKNGGTSGQDGNGKGQYKEWYTFRVWPQAFVSLLTDKFGNPLSTTDQAAYQNLGY